MRSLILGVSVLLVVLPLSALGQTPTGFYGGVGIGYVDLGADEDDIAAAARSAGVTGRVTDLDDSGFGWKIFGGYQFNPFLGAEVAYADLNDVNATFVASAPTAATVGLTAEAGALSAAVVGSYPLNRDFGVFAKLGLHYWDVNANATAAVGSTTVSTQADDDGVDVLFGVGANYVFAPQMEFRLEWERYQGVGSDTSGTDGNVDFLGGSLLYRFQ